MEMEGNRASADRKISIVHGKMTKLVAVFPPFPLSDESVME